MRTRNPETLLRLRLVPSSVRLVMMSVLLVSGLQMSSLATYQPGFPFQPQGQGSIWINQLPR